MKQPTHVAMRQRYWHKTAQPSETNDNEEREEVVNSDGHCRVATDNTAQGMNAVQGDFFKARVPETMTKLARGAVIAAARVVPEKRQV